MYKNTLIKALCCCIDTPYPTKQMRTNSIDEIKELKQESIKPQKSRSIKSIKSPNNKNYKIVVDDENQYSSSDINTDSDWDDTTSNTSINSNNNEIIKLSSGNSYKSYSKKYHLHSMRNLLSELTIFSTNDVTADIRSPITSYIDHLNMNILPKGPELQTNDANYKKRINILNEIISTEKTYIDGLKVLINEFILYLFGNNSDIKIKHKNKIKHQLTCNLDEILSYNKILYNKMMLKKEQNKLHDIVQILYQMSDGFNIYSQFVAEYDKICDLWGKLQQTNKNIDQYIRQQRKNGKPIANHLILPIQRIPRYLLLLNELKKYSNINNDNDNIIEKACDKMNKVANDINERQREIENSTQCLQGLNTIKNFDISFDEFGLINPKRQFIDEFKFTQNKYDGSTRKRKLFVFNDIIIIVNTKLKYKYLLHIETSKIIKNDDKLILDCITLNKPIHLSVDKNKSDLMMKLNQFERIINQQKKKQLRKNQKELIEYAKSDTKGKKSKVLNMLVSDTNSIFNEIESYYE